MRLCEDRLPDDGPLRDRMDRQPSGGPFRSQASPNRDLGTVIGCVCAGWLFAGGLSAQATADTTEADLAPQVPPPTLIATLSVWADQMWHSLLDRDGSYHGRLAREGTFQRFSRLMDSEYELDIRSGLYAPAEDVRWTGVTSGIRIRGASISPSRILSLVDWRQESRISGTLDLLFTYRREHSLTARRDYPWLGVRWHEVGGSEWKLETGFGIHFFKPSSDVELGLSRTWTDSDGADWSLVFRVVALDAFSNTIFNSVGVEEEEVEAHFDYETIPLAARAALRRASPRWLFEVEAGSSNSSDLRVTFPSTEVRPYTQLERVWFFGGLAQATPVAELAVALYGTIARADTERLYTDPSTPGFTLREETRRLGSRANWRLNALWAVETDLEWIWRPEERRPVGSAALEHEDRELFVRLGVAREPRAGWTGHLAYGLLDRHAGVRASWLTAKHERLTVECGYRFTSSFHLTAGVRWDLDNFSDSPFDGGHLRMVTSW